MSLLVIEGLDGSGKSTQVKKLQEYFEASSISFRYMHFPRTEGNVYADLVARFLRGELGDIDSVNPYLTALIYAGDRYDAKLQLESWLRHDRLVLLDRYVYSNIAYQCAKISDENEKKILKEWILETEYGYFGLPKPDLSLFLDVPFEFTEQTLSEQRKGADRWYLRKKKDIHEEDPLFQKKVREVYLSQKGDPDFIDLNCCLDGKTMGSPDDIFHKILKTLSNRGLIA